MIRNRMAALALGRGLLAPAVASALPLRAFDRGPDLAKLDLEDLPCRTAARRSCPPRGIVKLLERLVSDERPFARLSCAPSAAGARRLRRPPVRSS